MSEENEETIKEEHLDTEQYFKDRGVMEVKNAAKHGWRDLDSHLDNGGDIDNWISAEVFNERGKSVISSKKQKNNSNREMMQAIQEVNEVHRSQLDIRVQDLLRDRSAAIEDGEPEKVISLDKDIDKTKEGINKLDAAKQTISNVPNDNVLHEKQWASNNIWFHEDSPKGAYARELANKLISQRVGGEDLTNSIEKSIREHFPEKNNNRNKPGISDKAFRKSTNTEALTIESLNDEEKKIAQSLMNVGGKTEEDVLKILKRSRA